MEVLSGLARRLTIRVPSGEFERKVEGKLQEAKGGVQLRGFRPGRVPMKELRRRFGPAVRTDVAKNLMQSCYGEAVVKEAVAPAGQPELEILAMGPDVDFAFTAQFEILPEIALKDLSEIQVVRPQAEVTEADIDAMQEDLRRQHRTWREVERPAAQGDLVALDYQITVDGAPVEGGRDEAVPIILGEPHHAPLRLPEVDQAVAGMAIKESKTFAATPPDTYCIEHLRGRTAQFKVTVAQVKEPRLPALDDAFFQTMGVTEGGLAAFRDEVASNMRRELAGKMRQLLYRQVMAQLRRIHEVPLPEALVNQEIQGVKARMMAQLSPEQRKNAQLPDEPFRQAAERATAEVLIIRQIVQDHQLEADAESVRAEIERMAEAYSEPEAVTRAIYRDESRLNAVEGKVLENKVMDLVLAAANVEERQSSYQDVLQERAAPEVDGEDERDQNEDKDKAVT